jgi:hypothetical protein
LSGGKNQHAEGYADDDEEREEKLKKGFAEKAIHIISQSYHKQKTARLSWAVLCGVKITRG